MATAAEMVAGHVTLDVRKRDTDPGKPPQFSFTREQRRVSVFYIYIWDAGTGSGFIKICTYFPNPLKARVNGHEWVKRQALDAGIGFTELSNGFATCEDPAALQAICDRFGPGHVQVWPERWMTVLPLPLNAADRDGGFWWELPVRQVETSRTLVVDAGVHARAFFEALLCENMDLGRPENVGLLFRRGERRGSGGRRQLVPPAGRRGARGAAAGRPARPLPDLQRGIPPRRAPGCTAPASPARRSGWPGWCTRSCPGTAR